MRKKPDFEVSYYLPPAYSKVASGEEKVLNNSIKRRLKLIKKVKLSRDGTPIKIFVDDEDSVYYYSPNLWGGIAYPKELVDKNGLPPSGEKKIWFHTPGYCKITPFVSLLGDYNVVELRSLIVDFLMKNESEVSCKYEDILLECIQAVKEYKGKKTKC